MRPSRISFRTRHFVLWLLAAAGLLASAGCGDGKIRCYPVTGTVLVDSQPAEGAMVIFCPVDGSEEFMRERPFGVTDADGKFELRTFRPGDGAPAGNYKVMARWLSKAAQSSQAADQDRAAGGSPDRLRGRYFNPDTSGLGATVEEAPTELPPFELKSR